MQYKTILLACSLALLMQIDMSCKRFVEVAEPEFGIGRSQIFGSDAAAQAAVVNMYVQMLQGNSFTNGYGSMLAALYADELEPSVPAYGDDEQFYSGQLLPANGRVKAIWSRAYTVIYLANAVLEGLESATAVTDTLRKQMMGEAYFVRALQYCNLINCFGEVPLALSTDFYDNQLLPRSSVEKVYRQITADLQEALNRLPLRYPGIPGNIRATRYAANALLARVLLYQRNWDGARQLATQVIESGAFSLDYIGSVFLVNSPEIIFQLQSVEQGVNSAEGSIFLPGQNMPPSYVATGNWLSRLEPDDARKSSWLQAYGQGPVRYYPYKYKLQEAVPVQEYTVVLRLAEVYLIRAEASAQLGMLGEAIQDVNAIRARAQLPPLSFGLTQQEVLAAIEQERAVELWIEWGHRFFDLKRWPGRSHPALSRFQEVMHVYRPGLQQYRELWPIPAGQLLINTGWRQNPGY